MLRFPAEYRLICIQNSKADRLAKFPKTNKITFLIIVTIVIGLVFYNFSKLPGRNDIPGGFNEVAYIRNENNLGPIILYYAFTVEDIDRADYEALGKTLPFNKTSGITTAFMFDKAKPAPSSLSLEFPHFDTTRFQPIAVYVIDKAGNRKLSMYQPQKR